MKKKTKLNMFTDVDDCWVFFVVINWEVVDWIEVVVDFEIGCVVVFDVVVVKILFDVDDVVVWAINILK